MSYGTNEDLKSGGHDPMSCYACTANGKGDYDNKCWLDSEMENCWIKNKPARKEDCEYWERVYRGEL